MDPEACLRLADQAISDLDLEAAAEHLRNYREWRRKHGFEPADVAHSGRRGDSFERWCWYRIESIEAQIALTNGHGDPSFLRKQAE